MMARTYLILGAVLASLPLVVSGVKLYCLHSRVSSQTVRRRGRLGSDAAAAAPPQSLPAHVASDQASWTVHYERVTSSPIPRSSLRNTQTSGTDESQPSGLLRTYLQASHLAFSRTPQAFMLSLFIREEEAKHTFSRDHIQSLRFKIGDRVNGAYTVVYVGKGHQAASERVELALDPPKGYSGPAPQGRIISEVVRLDGQADNGSVAEDQVMFVNETWMWRKQEEPKTLLEGGPGAWVHALTSGWLILEGMRAVQSL